LIQLANVLPVSLRAKVSPKSSFMVKLFYGGDASVCCCRLCGLTLQKKMTWSIKLTNYIFSYVIELNSATTKKILAVNCIYFQQTWHV
jgi:hypothetical protein